MEMILKKAGHAVTLVGDGEEALEAMSQDEFDAALLDVNMPVLDGIETAQNIPHGRGGERSGAADRGDRRCDRPDAGTLSCRRHGRMYRETRRSGAAQSPSSKMFWAPAARARPARLQAQDSRVTEIAAHPRFRGNAAPVVDAEVILQLRSLGGNAFVDEVIGIFRREAHGKLAALRDALGRSDIQHFRAVSHGLRSVAVNVGAVRLAQSCVPYQTCSIDDLQNRAEMWVEQLVLELARVENALLKLGTPESIQGRG